MTPGEHELSQTIAQLSVVKARLLDEVQRLELHAAELEEQYRKVTEVLTPAQRKKLGLEVDPE